MKKEIELMIDVLSEKKAEDILVVQFEEGQHPVTDHIIVVSALNAVHLKSLCADLQRFYKKNKQDALGELDYIGVSGNPESLWVILDFNDLIIHIMEKDLRVQYDFDNLFAADENYRYH
jgi:ribosome-associated protein